jgi:hypothetical protein
MEVGPLGLPFFLTPHMPLYGLATSLGECQVSVGVRERPGGRVSFLTSVAISIGVMTKKRP